MESVLVGVDHSESSRRAVRLALKGAGAYDWSVTIAHVINWSRYGFPSLEDAAGRPPVRQAEIDRAQTEVLDPILGWITSEEIAPESRTSRRRSTAAPRAGSLSTRPSRWWWSHDPGSHADCG